MLRVLTSSFGYVCLLIALMLLAYWKPALGCEGGWLNPPLMGDLLVVMIFFVQGTRLNLQEPCNYLSATVGWFYPTSRHYFPSHSMGENFGVLPSFLRFCMDLYFSPPFYPPRFRVALYTLGSQKVMRTTHWVMQLYQIFLP